MIEVRGLACSRNGRRILRGISFTVADGEFLAIIGPNGAGKTTLLKCLLQLVPGWEGDILLSGTPIRSLTSRQLARQLAYVPQIPRSDTPYGVREFVLMGRYACHSPLASPGRSDHLAADRALDLAGIGELAERTLDTLSGGERQRAYIAAALAQEAPVLLHDEPSSQLDPRHRHEVGLLLRRLQTERGLTIVLVSHDLNEASQRADRILALRDGQVARLGPPEQIMTADELGRIFATRFALVPHPRTGRPFALPEE
ncbi:MAG: ABC transporter ATP-binding protein [Lentisphaeria bacterium]|jgi:iron complex transport system ATP-binding protein|nr:ABC transporter ATP-binding protein [Lentisphaeria bacterium]